MYTSYYFVFSPGYDGKVDQARETHVKQRICPQALLTVPFLSQPVCSVTEDAENLSPTRESIYGLKKRRISLGGLVGKGVWLGQRQTLKVVAKSNAGESPERSGVAWLSKSKKSTTIKLDAPADSDSGSSSAPTTQTCFLEPTHPDERVLTATCGRDRTKKTVGGW